MIQEEFGTLLKELRLEHLEKPGKPWTQPVMADKLSEELMKQDEGLRGIQRQDITDFKVISNIERGVRKLKPRELLAYAEALKLTSGERIEFFLGSCGIDSTSLVQGKDPKEIRNRLLQRKVEMPAYILDQYCDVVAGNEVVVKLLDLTDELSFERMKKKYSCFAYNMLQYVFSPEAVDHFQDWMGRSNWEKWAYQNMMMFRSSTLRYRTTTYYKELFDCLWQHPIFRQYWTSAYHIDKDYFIDDEEIVMNTSNGYVLSFFSSDTTAVTTAGELHYCVYIPTTLKTREHFMRLVDENSTIMIPMAPWPEKI